MHLVSSIGLFLISLLNKDTQKKIQIYDNIFAILESKYAVKESSPTQSSGGDGEELSDLEQRKASIQKSSLPIMTQVLVNL